MRSLSDAEIEKTGTAHNAILSKAFKNFDYQADDYYVELESQFKAIAAEAGFQMPFNPCSDGSIEVARSFLGTEYQIIENLEEFVQQDSKKNVGDISLRVDALQKRVKSTITDAKKVEVLLAYLEVYKKSSEFWLPVTRGGTGEGFEIYQKLHANSRTSRLSVRRCDVGVIAADATSAGGSLIIGAAVAGIFGGPIGWAYVVGVAASTAWGSATNALYNCPI